MIKHNVHALSGKCRLTFAESIAVDFISLLKGPKDLVNPASQDDGHLCRSFLIRHWRTHKNLSRCSNNSQNNIGDFGGVKYWRMRFSSPNSPKFSSARILRYTVHIPTTAQK